MSNSTSLTPPSSTSEPVPDLTGMRLSHRALTGDITRLAELLASLAHTDVPEPRARAVAAYIHQDNAAVRHHHHNEDDTLWPLIALSAGHTIDLTPHVDEHSALDPLQDTCDEAAARWRTRPTARGGSRRCSPRSVTCSSSTSPPRSGTSSL
ncbi:hemerythrin domain-containing protein [Streptomyces formicae]|uniref:Hemerythrin-like domain-containing protein n=1 Tax=Streptomyces formicae TaxID=1616117 RepID=A0A291QMT1_9ACTN|nr:hemerythrin domain-containing protein [Streptomyces formicae]ATL33150.1 hypothetical protein KY5_8132c [Streptomyces formicae]